MKKLFLATTLLLASAKLAAACPDMTGTWTCTNSGDDKTSVSTVTQENIPGGALYHITEEGSTTDWYADGSTRPANVGSGLEGTIQLSCQGDQVIAGKEIVFANDGSLHADIDMTYSVAGNKMEGTSIAHVSYSGRPEETQTVNFHCTR